MRRSLFILFFMAATGKIDAQFPAVTIPGSEIRTITSSIVAGQEYELHVLVPANYADGNKKYPVVYLMDSQWDFPLVKSIYGQQYYDGFIPELIIVGVTWGGVNPNPDSLRVRDYTPTNDGRQKQGGGADHFLSFMKNELFPFIEKNYRADSNRRVLMGCSLGGLVSLYALFTHSDMFSGYVAASPAIGWDKEVIYRYEKKFQEKEALLKANTGALRLYMTIGDVERSVPGFIKLSDFLEGRRYQSLSIRSKVLENTGHSGTKSETFSRALQYVFEKPALSLEKDLLDKYAGVYETAGHNKIEIKNEEGKLALYFSAANRYPLFAASNTEFYSRLEFLNICFRFEDSRVDGFLLERYGNSQFIKKLK